MKKKTFLTGLGAGTLVLAAVAGVKKLLNNNSSDEDINDEELTKIADENTDEDRGVGPVADEDEEIEEDEDETESKLDSEIPDLKADAINDGYQPPKY